MPKPTKPTSREIAAALEEHAESFNWGDEAVKGNKPMTPRTMAARQARARSSSRRRREAAKQKVMREHAEDEARRERPSYGISTRNVYRWGRSSFKRNMGRNPTSYVRSRRRRQGRRSRSTGRSSSSRRSRRGASAAAAAPAPVAFRGISPTRRHRSRSPRHAATHRRGHAAPAAAAARPRAGKVMRECRAGCTEEGCHRHKTTGDCKFVHQDEPEYRMLRPDQKEKHRSKGGYVSSPAPLSTVNTYTSWPGGIDPTVRLYDQAKML